MTLPASITDDLLATLTGRVAASGGDTWKLQEVYTGEVITPLPQSSADDIAGAYAAARRAQADWAQWPLKKRLAVFRRFHKLLIERNATIVDLIQAESGKSRRMAFEETCDPMMIVSHYLKRAPKLLKPVKRAGPVPVVSSSTEIHQPKGVIGIIAPWNFPFATGISDAIPALMAGNGVVLKPDNKTALSPLYGVHLLYEAGLPEGLFQVVCGEGAAAGPPVIDNANYVMFTGSTETGRFIGQRAGQNLIGACLELGGKNPMIVLDDVDLDEIFPGVIEAVFRNTGQVCMHVERMYVHASIYDDFKSRFLSAVSALRIGASYDFEPEVGSLVSVDHKDRVSSHVEDAREQGRHSARRWPGASGHRAGVLRADRARRRDQADACGLVRDVRPGGRAAPLLRRRGGAPAGQRHRLRPVRERVGERPRPRRRHRCADRVRQRQRQRGLRRGVRQQGHALRRRQAVRRRRPPR